MVRVVTSKSAPRYLDELRALFIAEWGQMDSFESNHPGVVVPSPLLALDARDKLVGGLAFSSYPKPETNIPAVWINALLITPEYRGMGLASRMIAAAEAEGVDVSATELFVLTGYPSLYEKLDWSAIAVGGADTILTKVLTR